MSIVSAFNTFSHVLQNIKYFVDIIFTIWTICYIICYYDWWFKYDIVHFCVLVLLSPAAPEARDGRYCNAPRPSVRLSVRPSVCPSVCPSVTFSFRTVTQKRIAVFSRNFAGTCTKSWGCAV